MQVEKQYVIPKTIEKAISLASEYRNSFKYIAGGTDVLVNQKQGNEKAACLVDLTQIEALRGINKEGDYLKIGSLEKLGHLKNNKHVLGEFSMLVSAARTVGSPLIRKSATLGGNILCENRCLFYNQTEWWREAVGYCLKCDGDVCIATGGKKVCYSECISDTAPALIAMNALIEYFDKTGKHRTALENIYSGDGISPRNLPPEAIVSSVLLPLGCEFKTSFHKLRERESLEFTSLSTAVSIDKTDKIKIALSGVDPKPVVVEGWTGSDLDALIKSAVKGARAVENDMYSRKYRREMIGIFLKRSFKELGLMAS